jgi:hypothetical protein
MTEHNTYPARVAKMIVENAIVYGMPVPRVAGMYDIAKVSAKGNSDETKPFADTLEWRARYFTLLRNIFQAGLRKYSMKMQEKDKLEIREILTRNREKLIEEWTNKRDTRKEKADT